jgi:hypothetical protein
VAIFCKRLEKVGQDATAAGREKIGADLLREKVRLERGLPDVIADPSQATDKQLEDLSRALGFYVKNLRAAAGTVKGLWKLALADDFTEEADGLEGWLTPLLTNQASLPLAPAPGEEPAAEPAPEGGEPAADGAAEPAIDEPESGKGLLSIGQQRGEARKPATRIKDFSKLRDAVERSAQ